MKTSATLPGVQNIEMTPAQIAARGNAEKADIASAELAGADLAGLPPVPATDNPGAAAPNTEPPAPSLSPREQRAQEVVAQQRRVRDQALKDKQNALPGAENTLKSEELPPTNAEKRLASFDGDEILKLKVDGNEVEMTVSEALAELQKGKTADRRLEQAVMRSREVEAREQQLLAREQPTHQPPAAGVDDAETKEALKQAVALIADGQDEDAVETLFGVLQRAKAPAITPTDVEQTVDQTIARRTMQETESALRESGEFADIFGDDVAYSLACQEVRRLRATNPDLQGRDLMVTAMQSVRDWRIAPVKDKLTTDPRMEMKERAAQPVRSTAGTPPVAPAQRKEEKSPAAQRSDLMARMRRARGQ